METKTKIGGPEKRAEARNRMRALIREARAKRAVKTKRAEEMLDEPDDSVPGDEPGYEGHDEPQPDQPEQDEPRGLDEIANKEPHEVGAALDELARIFSDVSEVFSGLAQDASNFKSNLDLEEPPKTASLKDRIAARRNYARTLRRLANEEPEELGAAISAIYSQLDEAAEGIEAMAERFGLPLQTEDAEGPLDEEPVEPAAEDDVMGDDSFKEPAPKVGKRAEREMTLAEYRAAVDAELEKRYLIGLNDTGETDESLDQARKTGITPADYAKQIGDHADLDEYNPDAPWGGY